MSAKNWIHFETEDTSERVCDCVCVCVSGKWQKLH